MVVISKWNDDFFFVHHMRAKVKGTYMNSMLLVEGGRSLVEFTIFSTNQMHRSTSLSSEEYPSI
jgi:hypothetical protein